MGLSVPHFSVTVRGPVARHDRSSQCKEPADMR